jgi:hypothetical protein
MTKSHGTSPQRTVQYQASRITSPLTYFGGFVELSGQSGSTQGPSHRVSGLHFRFTPGPTSLKGQCCQHCIQQYVPDRPLCFTPKSFFNGFSYISYTSAAPQMPADGLYHPRWQPTQKQTEFALGCRGGVLTREHCMVAGARCATMGHRISLTIPCPFPDRTL